MSSSSTNETERLEALMRENLEVSEVSEVSKMYQCQTIDYKSQMPTNNQYNQLSNK